VRVRPYYRCAGVYALNGRCTLLPRRRTPNSGDGGEFRPGERPAANSSDALDARCCRSAAYCPQADVGVEDRYSENDVAFKRCADRHQRAQRPCLLPPPCRLLAEFERNGAGRGPRRPGGLRAQQQRTLRTLVPIGSTVNATCPKCGPRRRRRRCGPSCRRQQALRPAQA